MVPFTTVNIMKYVHLYGFSGIAHWLFNFNLKAQPRTATFRQWINKKLCTRNQHKSKRILFKKKEIYRSVSVAEHCPHVTYLNRIDLNGTLRFIGYLAKCCPNRDAKFILLGSIFFIIYLSTFFWIIFNYFQFFING